MVERTLDREASLEVFYALQEAFSEEQACEHPGHATSVLATHGGPGEWYASIHCPDCNSKRVYVVCDPFKRYIQTSGMPFWCRACRDTLTAPELVVGFTPVRVGL